jgi:tRNA/rRNA methyltransferase
MIGAPTVLRAQLVVVLHQVRSPDNLGAIARLMANFDLPSLTLSDPLTYALREADKLAVKGARVLDSMRLTQGLPEAVEGCVFALGTTSRALEDRRALTPEEGIALLARHAARGKVALVLGGEKRGLSDDELRHCQEVCVIPTAPAQPSMNLAQAASVLLYLCSREGSSLPASPPPEGARLGTVHALEARMRETLLGAGFLNPQAPEHILTELTRSLLRGELSQREAELWLTAFRKLSR